MKIVSDCLEFSMFSYFSRKFEVFEIPEISNLSKEATKWVLQMSSDAVEWRFYAIVWIFLCLVIFLENSKFSKYPKFRVYRMKPLSECYKCVQTQLNEDFKWLFGIFYV